ncbi:chorismate-binding protein [Dyella marensis]|uniref:anthranilate synthase family protein n=1 Tax=Dyella marensis TaxID=500610 RepID=UPI0031DDBC7E
MSLLERIVSGSVSDAFALIVRENGTGPRLLEAYAGHARTCESFVDLPDTGESRDGVLVLIPYAQLRERGFACIDDGERLCAIQIREREVYPLDEVLEVFPEVALHLSEGAFDMEDEAYEEAVRRVIHDEIGHGEGANFVLKRTYRAKLHGYSLATALAGFRRLAVQESGAYWTFLVHVGGRTFIGASPERHVSVEDGVAVMNPISGTYRYPSTGPTLDGVLDFLTNEKEVDELYMVVDEELKMMAHFCPAGGTVRGPYLKEMSRLAHTEYYIEGRTQAEARIVLRQTLFAPTVTGSPIENACRVIARQEREGRGFYAGVIALIGNDAAGGERLDSAILIRTAEIAADGSMKIGVGSTIVRHSQPHAEAEETRAKAKALLAALGVQATRSFAGVPAVQAALGKRNGAVANFWLTDSSQRICVDPSLRGRRALIIDAEDAFTAMLAQQLEAIGLEVTIKSCTDPDLFDSDCDVAVLGPGPGDPRDVRDRRVASLRHAMGELLARRKAFLAVCLSHQILCLELGLDLVPRAEPNQGVQKEIDLFGSREWVGFYNSFVAKCEASAINVQGAGNVEVSRDLASNEVHALRGDRFASIQFHAESLLTRRGVDIIASNVKRVLSS